MNQTLIIGNIITMDEKRPDARAALVKDGVFAYIGSVEEAKKLAGADAQVLDYGENFIYPGFMESHCHSYLAGDRAIGQADLTKAGLSTDYAKYREIIRDFIEKNPKREFYLAAGWNENDEYVSKAYLDEICSDKMLFMQTSGGHSMLLNTKALEWAGIDAAYAKKMGYDLVHVDKNGEPDGYICEAPVFELYPKLPTTLENAKDYLLAWQDKALANGFTAVGDAGVEVTNPIGTRAFYELEQEGRLKLRTYAYLMCPDNPEDPKAEVTRIAKDRAMYSGEYFHVVGVKTFLDGVTEAHTGWQNQDYLDQPGYHGNERFNDHDKMVELIVAADREGMPVHVHSEGGGATHFMLGCIEDAEKITGDLDQRNVLAHLHFVTDEDIRRMAETGSVPAVPPLWVAKDDSCYPQEVKFVGQELADQAYPIKSFFDAGANVVFHSDYPVSPAISMENKLFELAARRRSVRRYTNEHIDDVVIEEIMKVALTAPASFGHQPVEFVVVRDKRAIKEIAACKSLGGSQIIGADAVVVTMVKLDRGEFWIEDGAIASSYVLLAAEQYDVGACWVHIRNRTGKRKSSDEEIRELLGVPEGYAVLNLVALGGKGEQKRGYTEGDFDKSKIHFERY